MPAVVQDNDQNVYSGREEKGLSNFKSLQVIKTFLTKMKEI